MVSFVAWRGNRQAFGMAFNIETENLMEAVALEKSNTANAEVDNRALPHTPEHELDEVRVSRGEAGLADGAENAEGERV